MTAGLGLDPNLDVSWIAVPVGRKGVIRYNAADFYGLGFAIRALCELEQTGFINGRDDLSTAHATGQIAAFVNHRYVRLNEATKEAGRAVMRLYGQTITQRTRNLAAGETVPELGEYQSKIWGDSLSDAAKHFQTLFLADCQEFDLFYFPQIEAYSTKSLLEDGSLLFPEAERAKIRAPRYADVLADVNDASTCLAAGLWTASGFHIARATERLMRMYSNSLRGRRRTEPSRETWVLLIDNLTTQGLGDQSLLAILRPVGLSYRNPFIHPEVVLTETELLLLRNTCVAASAIILSKLR